MVSKAVNFVQPYTIPPDWRVYSAVDIGSGGDSGHPAAISFVAVRPDYRKAAVFKMWRGDGIQTVDADILEQHTKMKHELLAPPVMQVYDWQAKDFYVIAARTGESFVPADKSHERGESILNVLFKNNMLDIFDTPDGEGKKLCSELVGLLRTTNKNKAKDDLCDTVRYNVVSIPWDWDAVTSDKLGTRKQAPTKSALELQIEARRGAMVDSTQIELDFDVEREIEEWNEYY